MGVTSTSSTRQCESHAPAQFRGGSRPCNELSLDSHWLHRKPMKHSARWNRRPNPGTGTSRHTRIFTHRPSEARIRRSCPDRFTGYLFIVWSKRRDVRAQISRRHLKQVQYRAKRGRRIKRRCAHIIMPVGLRFQLRASQGRPGGDFVPRGGDSVSSRAASCDDA
jgi:hypothetical protein